VIIFVSTISDRPHTTEVTEEHGGKSEKILNQNIFINTLRKMVVLFCTMETLNPLANRRGRRERREELAEEIIKDYSLQNP
jgi:hypothetical protein